MKTITIGRGDGANIIIDNEMISRRHAILKISTFGKMEIVDMGRNGTFVNGIRLRPNVPFPVTRKDVVRFADQDSPFKLDWSLVPDNSKIYKIAIAAIAGLLTIILLIVLIKSCMGNENETPVPPAKIEAPAQEPVNNSTAAPSTGSDNSEGVTGESREKNKEKEAKEKEKEEAKKQKEIEGKTIQQLFPETHKKKDANSTPQKSNNPVKPSNVKTKKNGKDGDKGSDKNNTVIM